MKAKTTLWASLNKDRIGLPNLPPLSETDKAIIKAAFNEPPSDLCNAMQKRYEPVTITGCDFTGIKGLYC